MADHSVSTARSLITERCSASHSAAIVTALALSSVNPDYHHFSVLDLSISYPHRASAKVNLWVFVFLSVILPIAVIVIVSLSLPIPAMSSSSNIIRERRRKKRWELNASLLGLGVSLATATIISTGVKNLTGKPRPDFLARCNPDLGKVAAHTVGGYGQTVSELWVMVDGGICQQADQAWLNDGFRSFPSGYATSETVEPLDLAS